MLFTHNHSCYLSSFFCSLPLPYCLFQVVATDNFAGSPRIALVVVTVSVTDVNDNTPRFSQEDGYTVVIDEGAAGRAVVGVLATDVDTGLGGTVRSLSLRAIFLHEIYVVVFIV